MSFTKIGPLLILMGFVATTLSICDPMGTLQRLIIKWPKRDVLKIRDLSDFKSTYIFGDPIYNLFQDPYIFAVIYSPEGIKKKGYRINTMNILTDGAPKERYDIAEDKIDIIDVLHIAELLEGLKQQTLKTKWITAEVDRITALIYFIVVISVFIAATLLYPVFLQKFAQVFENNYSTKLGILIFSILALMAVTYMFILRIRGLERKALTVFRYLTALEAIKEDKQNFSGSFEDIERYLDNNDWTLAEYWVKRIQLEYTELFLNKIRKY